MSRDGKRREPIFLVGSSLISVLIVLHTTWCENGLCRRLVCVFVRVCVFPVPEQDFRTQLWAARSEIRILERDGGISHIFVGSVGSVSGIRSHVCSVVYYSCPRQTFISQPFWKHQARTVHSFGTNAGCICDTSQRRIKHTHAKTHRAHVTVTLSHILCWTSCHMCVCPFLYDPPGWYTFGTRWVEGWLVQPVQLVHSGRTM